MTTNPEEQQPIQVQAPQFFAPLSQQTQHAVSTRGTPSTLNLDDIFGDCFFTPEGDTVFLSEGQQQDQLIGSDCNGNSNKVIVPSGESVVTNNASRPAVVAIAPGAAIGVSGAGVGAPTPLFGAAPVAGAASGVAPTPMAHATQFVPVPYAGGIATTGLDSTNAATRATTMGPAVQGKTEQKIMPIAAPPQQRHHLQYAMVNTARRKSAAGSAARDRKMSDQQKSERRERNREHAKRSRIRKKFLLESLQSSVALLKEENDKLRGSIRQNLGDEQANELLTKENLAQASSNNLIASNSRDANKVLDDPDFSFIKALQTAQQNFVVTDPSLPDNPIVYATQGFLNLTGYMLDQVLGRNCRFLQGPETDPKAVEKIRRSIEEGTDMSVCLLNYRVDGTTFWNQFFIAALRDAAGNITNYVGVQCKVSDQYAANVCKKQEEEFAMFDDQAQTQAQAPEEAHTATQPQYQAPAPSELAQTNLTAHPAATVPVPAPVLPVAAPVPAPVLPVAAPVLPVAAPVLVTPVVTAPAAVLANASPAAISMPVPAAPTTDVKMESSNPTPTGGQ